MFSLEQTDVKRATRPFLRGMGVARETTQPLSTFSLSNI